MQSKKTQSVPEPLIEIDLNEVEQPKPREIITPANILVGQREVRAPSGSQSTGPVYRPESPKRPVTREWVSLLFGTEFPPSRAPSPEVEVVDQRTPLEVKLAEQEERLEAERKSRIERAERENTVKGGTATIGQKARSVGGSFMSALRKTSLLNDVVIQEEKSFKRLQDGKMVPVQGPRLLCIGVDVDFETFKKIIARTRKQVTDIAMFSDDEYLLIEEQGLEKCPTLIDEYTDRNVIIRGRHVPDDCALIAMCSVGGEKVFSEHFVMTKADQALNYLKRAPRIRSRVPV